MTGRRSTTFSEETYVVRIPHLHTASGLIETKGSGCASQGDAHKNLSDSPA